MKCCISALLAFSMVCWSGVQAVHAIERSEDLLERATHRQVRLIRPQLDGESVTLHTMTTTADGVIVAALGGKSMRYQMNEDGTDYTIEWVEQPAAVVLLDHEGTELQRHDVPLTPSAVAVAEDGTIYVGGSGKLLRISPDGEIGDPVTAPHAGDPDELRKATIKALKESRDMMSGSFDDQIEMLREQIERIESKEEDDRTRLEAAQLQAFETQLEAIESFAEQSSESEAETLDEDEIESAMQQALSITSIAVSGKDLFVCAAGPSFSYNVWRIGRDLSSEAEPLVVLDGLSGCCGQMDIQCRDGKLFVGENTRFKVGIYDRDGQSLTDFGGRDRTSRAGFGSCCNPMNTLPMDDGSVLTAESSIGHIKRFDQEGNLVAYIGKAKIGGGCKHCSLGYNADEDLYFMMYQDLNAICVLANQESTPMTDSEKELLVRRDEFLSRVAGHWTHESVKDQSSESGGLFSALFGGGRGSQSPYPIASIQIEPNGNAKILEGMYQAYGDESEIEVLADDDTSDREPSESDQTGVSETRIALAIDQVRFAEGTWSFDGENRAEISFSGMDPITLHRRKSDGCSSGCGADGCAEGKCGNPDCGDPLAAMTAEEVSGDAALLDRAAKELNRAAEELDRAANDLSGSPASTAAPRSADQRVQVFDGEVFEPRFEYRLISPADFEVDGEARLNELGSERWEYCGRLGEKMMFKRIRYQTESLGDGR